MVHRRLSMRRVREMLIDRFGVMFTLDRGRQGNAWCHKAIHRSGQNVTTTVIDIAGRASISALILCLQKDWYARHSIRRTVNSRPPKLSTNPDLSLHHHYTFTSSPTSHSDFHSQALR